MTPRKAPGRMPGLPWGGQILTSLQHRKQPWGTWESWRHRWEPAPCILWLQGLFSLPTDSMCVGQPLGAGGKW